MSAPTWKTAESPYMGRVSVGPTLMLLLRMGPSPVVEELGRPTFTTLDEPSASDVLVSEDNASVPSWSQPVMG